MNAIQKILITVILTTVIISCKGSFLEAEGPPGRRDYTITVDTIVMQPRQFDTVWGAEEESVWAGGYIIWDFNGTNWSPHFDTPAYRINTIFGFSETDVWAVNSEGRIYHYNGESWILNYVHGPEFNNPYTLADIWGLSPNNIYVVGGKYLKSGFQGLILHYNGNEWKELEIEFIKTYFRWIRKGQQSSNFYLIGNNIDLTYPDSSRIFEFSENKLKEIYIGEPFKESEPYINTVGGEIYFAFNKKIHRYRNKQFQTVRSLDHKDFKNIFYGRSLNDLILPTRYGIMHYDGETVEYLYYNLTFIGMDYCLFDNGFIGIGFDINNYLNLVVRGTLKK
jgi:hypothetical protein